MASNDTLTLVRNALAKGMNPALLGKDATFTQPTSPPDDFWRAVYHRTM
jgi:hypothetical protein